MSDLIDRQQAIDEMERLSDVICEYEAIEILAKLPTVDAVPVKRGMWTFIRLTDKDYGHKAKECSSCGSTFFDTRQWNYCPNCGANMKAEHE